MIYDKDSPDRESLLRIKAILILRVLFLTGFVIMIFIFQQQSLDRVPIVPLSITIGVAYFLSLIYALLLKYWNNLFFVAAIQTMGDLVIVGGIIFSTGGIESPLSFLYSLVIVASGVMLPRSVSYFAASVASISYGLLIDLDYYGVINPIHFFLKSRMSYEGNYAFYLVFINIASFYAVAYLSSSLSHRLRLVKEQLALASSDLRDLRVFHKNVVQSMGNGLLTTDLDGRVTSMNPAAETISGVSFVENQNRFCYQLLPIPQLKDFFLQRSFGLLPQRIEGECLRSDGKTIFIRLKMSRLVEDRQRGGSKGFICVFDDLTEIRDMEEKIVQSGQLAALGRFSASLAHEIRNPLASLSGSIQVLYKGLSLEGSYQRLMEIVLQETERLNGIVTDFLSFSHPDKNQNKVVDLTQLVRDVVTLMKNSSEYDTSINIEFKSDDDHLLINGDEQQLKQMVWNLCLNGIQAMTSAGVLKIHLDWVKGFRHGTYETDQNGVKLVVEDQGCGISPDKVKKIFDLFYTSKANGVGLGLVTVQQIVEGMKGYIGVDSEVGAGARFSIFLPQTEFSLSIEKTPPVFTKVVSKK